MESSYEATRYRRFTAPSKREKHGFDVILVRVVEMWWSCRFRRGMPRGLMPYSAVKACEKFASVPKPTARATSDTRTVVVASQSAPSASRAVVRSRGSRCEYGA